MTEQIIHDASFPPRQAAFSHNLETLALADATRLHRTDPWMIWRGLLSGYCPQTYMDVGRDGVELVSQPTACKVDG